MVINSQFDYIRAIRDDRSLSSNAKLVGLMIASHFNWVDDDPAFPSNRLLSEETSISERSVIRAKSELQAKGWIRVSRRMNNSNLYVPSIPTGDTESLGVTESHKWVTDSHLGGDTDDNLKDNIKDNLKDNNTAVPAVVHQEEAGTPSSLINYMEYLSDKISTSELFQLINDKDTYFNILKERKARGIF
jgi:hypothetical protein